MLSLCFFLWTSASAAQEVIPTCAARATIVSHLFTKYGETPIGVGLAANGGLIEVLSRPDGASWTIIISMPNGVSCLLATGESWSDIPRVEL